VQLLPCVVFLTTTPYSTRQLDADAEADDMNDDVTAGADLEGL